MSGICGTGDQRGRSHRKVPEIERLLSGPGLNPKLPVCRVSFGRVFDRKATIGGEGEAAERDTGIKGLMALGRQWSSNQPEWRDLGEHLRPSPETLESQPRLRKRILSKN